MKSIEMKNESVNLGAAADEQVAKPLSLEVGKWYQCEDEGYVVNIVKFDNTPNLEYPYSGYKYVKGSEFNGRFMIYTETGNAALLPTGDDLICEIPNPFEEKQEELSLEVGKFYECRNGFVVKCNTSYLQDTEHPFRCAIKPQGGTLAYSKTGICGSPKKTSGEYDIIKEIPNPATTTKQLPQATEQQTNNVNHPPHYGGADNPYEVIKVVEEWDLNFHLGNAVTYIAGAGKKDADKTVEDLEKAVWYINREIAKIKQSK